MCSGMEPVPLDGQLLRSTYISHLRREAMLAFGVQKTATFPWCRWLPTQVNRIRNITCQIQGSFLYLS